ncbi:hypothetical protein Tco_1333722, partial [Tanacetum coccineum]
DIFKTVSTVVHSGTAGELSVAGTTGIMTVVGVIGGRSLEPAAMMLLCISLSVVEVTIGVVMMNDC